MNYGGLRKAEILGKEEEEQQPGRGSGVQWQLGWGWMGGGD